MKSFIEEINREIEIARKNGSVFLPGLLYAKTLQEQLEPMDFERFYENVKTHFEELCTEEIRIHACADATHNLDFQIFRILSGYQSALDELSNLRNLKEKKHI